jgi:hypothetical protein
MFEKAKKGSRIPKILIMGPAGGGKTLGAIKLMRGIIQSDKFLLADTEDSSATIYHEYDFFHTNVDKKDQNVTGFLTVMKNALDSGMQGFIQDSMSPYWNDLTNRAAQAGGSFSVWKDLTPVHDSYMSKILSYKIPFIGTARTKQGYVIEQINGKNVPKKVGQEPVLGKDADFNFDIVFYVDPMTHRARIDKCRYREIEEHFEKEGGDVQLSEELGKLIAKITLNQ